MLAEVGMWAGIRTDLHLLHLVARALHPAPGQCRHAAACVGCSCWAQQAVTYRLGPAGELPLPEPSQDPRDWCPSRSAPQVANCQMSREQLHPSLCAAPELHTTQGLEWQASAP